MSRPTARVGVRHPSRSHHAPDRTFRPGRRRSAIVALAGLAMVASGLFSPIAAASPTNPTSTSWRATPARSVALRHVGSARIAAATASEDVRPASPSRPRLKARIAHPPAATGSPVTGGQTITVRPQIVGPPELTPTQAFTGLNEAEGGSFYPPDPWVAVSGSYVVQVVNSTARVSNRTGSELTSIPTWALFALPAGQYDSDARIIWDAVHARWVASSLSFNGSGTDNYLNLAVSDGADPTAGWTTYSFSYGTWLPDFPSIASSSDKIVLTDNLFDDTLAFVGADLVTVTWASVIAGVGPTVNECASSAYVHPRAAQLLSSSGDVHVVFESTDDGSQWYWRLRGLGRCEEILDGTELTGFSAFQVPPDPRQPGDTMVNAIDERPTDAVWQNGRLWWVSTFPWTYDAGATFNDAVVLWTATTQTNGPAIEGVPQTIAPGDGIDAYMGGIGLTRGGTVVATYSQSSAADFISLMANQVPLGGSLASPIELDSSSASYGQERWGDYAGVATDPIGTGSVWATHQLVASDGSWRTTLVRLVTDGDLPSLPGPLTPALVVPAALGRSVPVRLTWAASTDVGSGVARYQVQQSVDAAPFVDVTTSPSTTLIRQLLVNHVYQFQIRALDAVGNAGPWRVSTTLRPYVYQSNTPSTVYTTGWGSSTSSSFSGGSTKYSTTAGKYATFTATNARSISIIATKAATRGSFKVYVDGVYKGAISTYSTTTKFRQLVYQFSWAAPGTHKVRVVISGTAGHPRVDLDAFVVLR
jgi:hypothetical protein